MKQGHRRPTNWDRYFQRQMRDPMLRRLVDEELKALRVGAEIAQLRTRCRLSQGQLAARAAMSAPNLSRIENSPGQNLTLGTLVRLARAMDRDVAIRFGPRRGVAAGKR
ncbi:MAG TPA: helix-turn-helix transcriptional regulator [Gemmatimonadales bacterium]|nr:helix-turn-helix transcriptional regulator [Gemmatimonadales bacterium]